MLKMLGDLNKDGKMSAYETKRQNAIEKSMEKQEAPSPANQTKKDTSVGKEAMKAAMKGAAEALASRSGQMAVAMNPAVGAISAGKAAFREGLKAGIAARKLKTKSRAENRKLVEENGSVKSPANQTKKEPKKTTRQQLDVKRKSERTRLQLDVKRTSVDKGERSKKMGVDTVKERQAQRDAARKAERKSGPSSPRKMAQSKSKNSGQKKTLDGNVIKYEKNSPTNQTKKKHRLSAEDLLKTTPKPSKKDYAKKGKKLSRSYETAHDHTRREFEERRSKYVGARKEKNSAANQTKNPSSGFDGYTKIASSKSSNVIAAKKAAASRKNPKSTYKFTKDKKTGETHLYQKG